MTRATALIAEDEPLLASELRSSLAGQWPELEIVAAVADGASALEQALLRRPDVLFLDVRMPAMSGLEVAQALGEDWPDGPALPLIVFVTAYDQYAVAAFEREALDYLLKPVEPTRLTQTCQRLKASLAARHAQPAVPQDISLALAQLRGVLGAPGIAPPQQPRLTMLQASIGNTIHLVAVADVVYFEAADKYVRVVTAERDYLIRLPLRQLLPQLDPAVFWQVRRSLVVRAAAIASALRDESGRVELSLRQRAEKLCVSRLYAHLFRGM